MITRALWPVVVVASLLMLAGCAGGFGPTLPSPDVDVQPPEPPDPPQPPDPPDDGPGTVYVDADAPDGGDGSQQRPVNDLQMGANLAQAGQTIHIAAGTYTPPREEPVYVLKPVNIEGEGRDTTVIEAAFVVDARDPNFTMNVTDLACDRVLIDREATTPSPLLIQNCSLNGVADVGGERTHHITVEDSDIGGVALAYGDGASRDTFRRCTIANGVGIAIGNGAIVEFTDCVIGEGVADSSGASTVRLLRCDLRGGDIVSKGGVAPDADYALSLVNCTGIAKVVLRPESANLVGCEISGPVTIAAGTPTNIIDNTITAGPVTAQFDGDLDQEATGLTTASGEGVVTGNTISGFEVGIVDASGATLFANNTVSNCGTGLITAGLAEFRNNVIQSCTGDGAHLGAIGGPFHHNTITGNSGVGVVAMGDADLGGGANGSEGGNVIRNNVGGDLKVETLATDVATIFATNNTWTHATEAEIAAQDIYDGVDDATLSVVDFTPFVAP